MERKLNVPVHDDGRARGKSGIDELVGVLEVVVDVLSRTVHCKGDEVAELFRVDRGEFGADGENVGDISFFEFVGLDGGWEGA